MFTSNFAPVLPTGEGSVTVYPVAVPAHFRIPPKMLVGTVVAPVTVTTFPLKVGTLTVTLMSCSASATFVQADIDLRTLPLSRGVPVAGLCRITASRTPHTRQLLPSDNRR